MAALVVSCKVTRPELGLADLELEDPGTYRVVAVGPGALTWRRQAVTSPFTDGEWLVAATREHGSAQLHVRIYGATLSQVETRTAALVAAVSQFGYELVLVIDGATWRWQCEPADVAPAEAGHLEPHRLRARMQEYRLVIPRSPIPVAGAL